MWPQRIAEFTARCEKYVGTESGGMDQAISIMGEKGLAKLVHFKPVRLSHTVCQPFIQTCVTCMKVGHMVVSLAVGGSGSVAISSIRVGLLHACVHRQHTPLLRRLCTEDLHEASMCGGQICSAFLRRRRLPSGFTALQSCALLCSDSASACCSTCTRRMCLCPRASPSWWPTP